MMNMMCTNSSRRWSSLGTARAAALSVDGTELACVLNLVTRYCLAFARLARALGERCRHIFRGPIRKGGPDPRPAVPDVADGCRRDVVAPCQRRTHGRAFGALSWPQLEDLDRLVLRQDAGARACSAICKQHARAAGSANLTAVWC
jgi:hypothetical protein